MRKTSLITGIAIILLVLFLSAVSALSVSVDSDSFSAPGTEGKVRVDVENTLDDDIEDVSVSLQLTSVPFSSVGSSQDSVDSIDSDDEETFSFTLKSANDLKPGDYKIPYTLSYKVNDESKEETGTIGITVKGNPDLGITASLDNPVINKQGKVNLKIINKGFGDARFVTLTSDSSGMTFLSETEIYIGTISSDDFETASYDVMFKKTNPTINVQVEYVDFDNKKVVKEFDVPLTVYSQEKAKELGIIKPNRIPLYIGIIVVIIILWFVYRNVQKRRRMRRSMRETKWKTVKAYGALQYLWLL